jgi:hypothetical protein
MQHRNITAEDARLLALFPSISVVDISFSSISSDALMQLADMPHLEYLDLFETDVTVDDIRRFVAVKRVRTLCLSREHFNALNDELRAAHPHMNIIPWHW